MSRRVAGVLAGALLLPTLTACSGKLDDFILGEEDTLPSVDSNLLHADTSGTTSPETEVSPNSPIYPFDTTQIHDGTGIAYAAPEDSPNKLMCVVIDAGHQAVANTDTEPIGPDADQTVEKATTGAVGTFTKRTEHALNLAVALELRNELCRRGYNVVMVRETAKVDISDRERAELANDVADDYDYTIYVRIHAATSEDPAERGAAVVIPSESNPYPSCAAVAEESRQLAESILTRYTTTTSNVRPHATPVRVDDTLSAANWSCVPTTAVILGYLSYESEDVAMSYDGFHTAAGVSIAGGIMEYFRRLTNPDDDEHVTVEITDPMTEPVTESELNLETQPETQPETEMTPETAPVSESESAHDSTEEASF